MEQPGASGRYGRLGGRVCDSVPAILTSAYATGQRLGALQELQVALASETGAAELNSITVVDGSNQAQAMDIFFFADQPTIVSGDQAAFDITNAELAKCLGFVQVKTTDYAVAKVGANAVATVRNIRFVLGNTSNPGSTSVWAVAVIRGAATYGSASALKFRYGVS